MAQEYPRKLVISPGLGSQLNLSSNGAGFLIGESEQANPFLALGLTPSKLPLWIC
jgi:hypothetical protein